MATCTRVESPWAYKVFDPCTHLPVQELDGNYTQTGSGTFSVEGTGAVTIRPVGAACVVGTATSGTTSITSAGALDLDGTTATGVECSAGPITIGGDAVAQNVLIATGNAARGVTIGDVLYTAAVDIAGDSASLTTRSGKVVVTSGDAVEIDADQNLELNSSDGTTYIGNDINAGVIVGNTDGATGVWIRGGTDEVTIESANDIHVTPGRLLDVTGNMHISNKFVRDGEFTSGVAVIAISASDLVWGGYIDHDHTQYIKVPAASTVATSLANIGITAAAGTRLPETTIYESGTTPGASLKTNTGVTLTGCTELSGGSVYHLHPVFTSATTLHISVTNDIAGGTHTSTWSGPWAAPVSYDMRWERHGRCIRLFIPSMVNAFNGAAVLTLDTVLPENLRPDNQCHQEYLVTDNSTAAYGAITVTTAGVVEIGLGATRGNFVGPGGNSGTRDRGVFAYDRGT